MPNKIGLVLTDPATNQKTERVAEVMRFSAFRCFSMTGEADEVVLAKRLAAHLISLDGPVLFYKLGAFLDFLLECAPELASKVAGVVDEEATVSEYRGIPCFSSFDKFAQQPAVVFICTTRTEERWRYERKIPAHMTHLSPDFAKTYGREVPLRAWIEDAQTIYPMTLPDIEFQPDLDVILLGLPSTYTAFQMPAGLAYVNKALERSDASFQTYDFAIICYHRVYIHQFYDLGEMPATRNGMHVADFDQNRVWTDPRQWTYLVEYFESDIAEITRKLCAANPKVLGMSIHQNNEWIGRELARRIKKVRPDIMILVGGHSCYAPDFGAQSFPEHDYLVVGEGDLVVGPLVEALANGERPKNLPGVVSKYDDADYVFLPGPIHHDLDLVGGLDFNIFDDMNAIYRSWEGQHTTALPLTRGCVWSRCTFCAERFAFRSRTPKNYVDEIEAMVNSGRGGVYQSCDSDFGGNPDVIHEVCEEIIRRGLKINFSGQIRINKKYDFEFFKLMRAAGINTMNFGMDAVTDNLLRLQRKGYTSDMLIQNLEDCYRAGIQPSTNFVIGIPGETEDDINETLEIIKKHIQLFPMIHNVNAFDLVHNSVYWHEPEKHDIYFYGDKEEIYKQYHSGVPQNLWYSLNPFMDKEVRFGRVRQLMYGLNGLGIPFTRAALKNFSYTMGAVSFLEGRNMAHDPALSLEHVDRVRMPPRAAPPVAKQFSDNIVIVQTDGTSYAVPFDDDIYKTIQNIKLSHWWNGELR